MEEINTREFNQKIANGNVLVDFYGPGCINCRMLEPTLTALEPEYPHVKFMKINVNSAPNQVRQYEITSLPTMIFFKDGKPLQPFVGMKPRNLIKRAIEDLFN